MPDWPLILRRDGTAVWRTVFRIVGHHADAEECFQEAFADAVKVSSRGPVRHWRALLQRLATARAVDRLRERVRRRCGTADWEAFASSQPPPGQEAEDAELAEQLRGALAALPAKQAEVFCLVALEGWSYADAGRELNATVNAVGVLLHRARGRLRELMADALLPEGGMR